MSQRTRIPTTDAAIPSRPESTETGARAATSSRPKPTAAGGASRRRGSAENHAIPSLDPTAIAQTLRAVADVLERDPALARRVAAGMGSEARAATPPATTPGPPSPPRGSPGLDRRGLDRRGLDHSGARPFKPRLVVGTPPELGPGIPNPFALFERFGPDGLRMALAGLRLGTLRAIVREHRLDPSGRIARQNDADRLRALILEAAAARR